MDRGDWHDIVHEVARVRHDLVTKPPPPTPVFLPGESHGQRSLAGYIVPEVAKSGTRLSD